MAKEYTQTVKPVSRIAEKIFGWTGWLLLLALIIGILFFSLVTMNDPARINEFTAALEQQIALMDMEGVDPQAAIDAGIAALSNSWVVAVFLMFPLIIAILGLLNMKRRILAGILLLVAAILVAPMVFTLVISLFFVIAAILLFARKDIVIRNDSFSDDDRYASRDSDQRRVTTPADDDVRVHDTRSYNSNNNEMRDNDIESTRKFKRIDEEDDTRIVDTNIDSQNIERPVTDREYKRQSGIELEDLDELNKEDPTQTRRDNVDRRNRE